MRLQLIRIALVIAVLAPGARADNAAPVDPYAQPAPAAPGASQPAQTAPGDSDTVNDGDYRDVFAPKEAPPPDPDAPEPATGTVRAGIYDDSDKTRVYRVLGVIAHTFGQWSLNASVGIDAVSSASVDVRSSPALSKIDVVTGASGRSTTSGGEMTDRRYQVTGGAGWKDSSGHAASLTAAVAKETDYASVSGGINGQYDIDDRNTTLLGGVTLTDSWVSSVLDSTIHGKLFAAAWTTGVARVLTRDDAIRVRYDGKLSFGDQASPYRQVRFGDWSVQMTDHQNTFTNTIGSADGLMEKVPEHRISHAAVVEWVHSLATGIGLHPELRVGHDSWSINSLTASLDLRIARPTWRARLGYRFYMQSSADFFHDKYTMDPSMYAYYTSDKELGDQYGHLGSVDFSLVLSEPQAPNQRRVLLNLELDAVHYRYPGFTLLPSRDSLFASAGISWEL